MSLPPLWLNKLDHVITMTMKNVAYIHARLVNIFLNIQILESNKINISYITMS